jgi:hypothetical protein
MFLNYDDFIFESELRVKPKNALSIARRLLRDNKQLRDMAEECKNGQHSKIQIRFTQGSKSYVGVATNSRNPVSAVFKTESPSAALVAMVISNTGQTDASEIIGTLRVKDMMVEYAIFPGTRKLSQRELIDKYNMSYSDYGEYIPVFIGSPVIKVF